MIRLEDLANYFFSSNPIINEETRRVNPVGYWLEMTTKYCYLFLVSLLIVIPSNCAPKSKKNDPSPHTVYDQKQTGDYNIQLHLKDFQIIALLSGDSSPFGDYDYSYDYSDFTVKPATQKPEGSSSIPSSASPIPTSTPIPENPTSKPPGHPYPILLPLSTESPKEKVSSPDPVTIIAQSSSESTQNSEETSTLKTPKKDETNSPGKIKVQIIEAPLSVGIVPGEDIHEPNEGLPQGEVALKRCASGFSRDKRGRCRRVRKPGHAQSQLPYGFSRFASNLASRFRQASSEISSSSSESAED